MNNIRIYFFILICVTFVCRAYATDIMCESGKDNFYAEYTPTLVQCDNGSYLPAGSVSCSQCSDAYSCSGGNFYFNEKKNQGIDYNHIVKGTNICALNFPSNLYAVYELARIECNPGYYLPENTDSCTICPAGNACPGGNLSFNETTAQGITACSGTTPYAPAGSTTCYPKMLHLSNENLNDVVYLKSTETTTPAFHVEINGTTYHANMTTTPTYMTAASEHYLKIMVDNVEYYVCDDTTYVSE